MRFWQSFFGFDPSRTQTFPGQQAGEEVELMTVRHWMSLMPFFLQIGAFVLVLIGFSLSGFFAEFSDVTQMFIITISLAILCHLICFRLYNYFLKVILITNFRVIDIRHSVFLKREREAIPMFNIQDFRFQQSGVFPRLFNYGTLMILGSSTDVKYVFRFLPKVNKIHHILGEIHQKTVRREPSHSTPVERGLPQAD
jgi:membrane protein YdbS with pleckstrin-like domain